MEFCISVRYDSMLNVKKGECLGEGRGDPVATVGVAGHGFFSRSSTTRYVIRPTGNKSLNHFSSPIRNSKKLS